VFTQCPDEEQRRAFITALHAAATAGHGPDQAPAALVTLGVRADFEARCADYPQLADAVQNRYLVTAGPHLVIDGVSGLALHVTCPRCTRGAT
jgi:hypothetical protein